MKALKSADLKQNVRKSAKMLKALANYERLLILCQLVDCELSVSDLLKQSQLGQSAFSQHLAVLRREKLVKTRKEQQVVYYSILDDNVVAIISLLHQLYC